jgi:hypothetical protein
VTAYRLHARRPSLDCRRDSAVVLGSLSEWGRAEVAKRATRQLEARKEECVSSYLLPLCEGVHNQVTVHTDRGVLRRTASRTHHDHPDTHHHNGYKDQIRRSRDPSSTYICALEPSIFVPLTMFPRSRSKTLNTASTKSQPRSAPPPKPSAFSP